MLEFTVQELEDLEVRRSIAGTFRLQDLTKRAIFKCYKLQGWKEGGPRWAKCVARAYRLRYRSMRHI